MLIRTIIVILISVALKYTYDLSGKDPIVAIFSSVNQSIWETIKAGLSATIFVSFIDFFIYKGYANYYIAKFFSFALIIALVPGCYHLVKYKLKKRNLWIDIALYSAVILISQFFFILIVNMDGSSRFLTVIDDILMLIMLLAYFLFTFKPLRYNWFRDPETDKCGIKGHVEHKPNLPKLNIKTPDFSKLKFKKKEAEEEQQEDSEN